MRADSEARADDAKRGEGDQRRERRPLPDVDDHQHDERPDVGPQRVEPGQPDGLEDGGEPAADRCQQQLPCGRRRAPARSPAAAGTARRHAEAATALAKEQRDAEPQQGRHDATTTAKIVDFHSDGVNAGRRRLR